MKVIFDPIKVADSYYSLNLVPQSLTRISINAVSPEVLLGNLNKKLHPRGIIINPDYSEKRVNYILPINQNPIRGKEADIPFNIYLNEHSRSRNISFSLRDGKGLLLKVEDFKSPGPNLGQREYTPGSGFMGVVCNMTAESIRGDFRDGAKYDFGLIELVEDALNKTYNLDYEAIEQVTRNMARK